MDSLLSQLLTIDPRIVSHIPGDATSSTLRASIGSSFTPFNLTNNYDNGATGGCFPIRASFNGSNTRAQSPAQSVDSSIFPTTLTFLARFRTVATTNQLLRFVTTRTATGGGGVYGYDFAANPSTAIAEIAVLAGGTSSGTTLINFNRTASGIANGQWHTVGFSVTTTTNTVARIWYDGAQLGATGSMTGTMSYGNTTAFILLGNFDTGSTARWLNGDLAAATIWNAELTAAQVAAVHATHVYGPSSSQRRAA